MKTRPRNLVGNQIIKLISLISRMKEPTVMALMYDYQAMTSSNCAWYEYRLKPLVLEICRKRIQALRQGKQNGRR